MNTNDILFQVIRVAEIEDEIKAAAADALTTVATIVDEKLRSRWVNAITRGRDHLLSQDAVEYDPESHTLVYISDERVYFANGSCQCTAFKKGTPCKHRAAGREVRRALERKA